jgi:hypothetical protein
MPAFFIPEVEPEKYEEVYQDLANACGWVAPPVGDRVYSITFSSKGETWTATVGEKLKGTKVITKGRGRTRREFTAPLSNESTVIAIFPGVPFHVWHNGASRVWANPFLAGDPMSVTKFSK